MIIPSKFNGYAKDGIRRLYMGGGGGGQTTSTVQNTNVPEYARPYVENMLGATQEQLFQGTRGPSTTNPETGEVTQGNFNITGFKPYQAYGGQYDAQGNAILGPDGKPIYDAGKAVAGFSPEQIAAQRGIAGMQLSGNYQTAADNTKTAYDDITKLARDYKASTYGNQFTAPSAYTSGTFGGQQVSAPGLSQYSMDKVDDMTGAIAGITQLGPAPTINQSDINLMSAAQLGNAPTAAAAQGIASQLSAAPTAAAAQGTAAQLRDADLARAARGEAAMLGEVPTYQGTQLGYTPQNIGYDRAATERINALPLERLQMQSAGDVGTGTFTQPGAADKYMSPYMQSVVDAQQREVQRQADIAKTQRSAQAVRAGAFGGSRQAIENAEAARNLATQKSDIQAQGLQSAFQQAQQQYNTEQQLGLQAALANQQVQQQTGVQNLSALLQTQGLGAQTGLTAQTANQQTALQAMLANQGAGIDTSKFNQTQQYNAAMQNAQLAQQQQLSNQALQGQFGLTQGQMNQQMNLANLTNEQQTALADQAARNQFGLTQGQMDQQMGIANLSNAQQTALANQALQGQYGLQQGQMSQQMGIANLTNEQQTALANQALQGQYGLQQGQMNQQMGVANLSNEQQTALANQALQGQYGLQQGQMSQAANAANQAAKNQALYANQGIMGQYGLQQGQMNQAVNLANQASQNQAAAQNQQMAFNAAQQNLAAKLGIQQLGAGQSMQASLANQQNQLAAQQAAEQSKQFGAAQGLNAAQLSAQYGLAGQQLSEQAKQFGGQFGLQANTQALGAANQYANLANQQQQAQLGIYGAQNASGAQQQALEQQKINQSMQDYANAQQYPLMQLGTMSNMLRGLPMQASTTNQYQAAPNQLTQAIGAIGSGASIYNAMKPGGAAGGLPSEFKYAKGGITSVPSYDMGGEVESQLESMDEKGLAAQAKESSSPSIRRMAQRLLRERQMSKQPQGTGPMGVQYQAAQPPMPSMRAGGIIAFQQGAGGNGSKSAIEEGGDEEARVGMQERLAMPPAGGIMGAAPPAAPAPPPAPTAGGAVQQAAAMPEFMKAQYADAEKRSTAPLSSFMAERQAAMREAGIADISEGQQKQRAELMAERANMGEEKERQRHLRLAEFFATWGSTPGPTLVAGMNALKKSVPGIISDEKEQKKARREIDKSIADLDNATRLEKRGEVDAAMALKLKAAEEMKALNMKFIDYQSRRDSDATSAASSKYSSDMQYRVEQLRANTQRLDRAAIRETANDNKAFGQYQTAAQNEQRVIAKIIDQAKLLEKDYATVKTAEMSMGQNDGKMPAALVPGYEAAKKKIADQEAIWNKQKEAASKDTELAYSRIRIRPEATTAATGSPAPAPAGGLETGDFPAPTAAHIAALKANPSQREAFDKKFGPGAANEYSGR